MTRRIDSESAGLKEVRGTYGDVVIGSVIQGTKATLNDVWDIIDIAQPKQYDVGMTGWFRASNRATGEVAGIPPRVKLRPCVFMVDESMVDPEVEKPKLDPKTQPARTPYPDQDKVDLLVRELGATELGVKDEATGIWTCPPFEQIVGRQADVVDHLRVAHGIDMSGVEDSPEVRATLHGKAHSASHALIGKGGFSHEHQYAMSRPPFGNLE